MMEHAKFFVMLMPGPELAAPRRQAEQFQPRSLFVTHFVLEIDVWLDEFDGSREKLRAQL